MSDELRRQQNRLAMQRHRARNRDEINRRRRLARADPGVRAKLDEQRRALEAALREQVFAHYGQHCACCGTADDLSIDHMNGGGTRHRQEVFPATDGSHVNAARFYAWIVREGFPPGLQTLCVPCNSSKSEGAHCTLWHGDPSLARCTRCSEVKALDQFAPLRHKRNGRGSWCMQCVNDYRRSAH